MNLRIKKGDTVKVIAGKFKGQTGKVTAVHPRTHSVNVEGINTVKRAVKPNMMAPQGGITEVHKPIDVSKVAILHPIKKEATSRIGFTVDKDGNKKRVYKNANNKEIN